MMNIIWKTNAKEDLKKFYDYLKKEAEETADIWKNNFLLKLENLQYFPEMGPQNADFNCRQLYVHPAWVFYEIKKQTIFIIAFFHHAQENIPK